MDKIPILVLCLTILAIRTTEILGNRGFQFDRNDKDTHEFQTRTRDSFHDGIENSAESNVDISYQKYSDQGSVKLESNGKEGTGFDGVFHESFEDEGRNSAESFNNQHLGARDGHYVSRNSDNSFNGEEEKSIDHTDGSINKENSNDEEKGEPEGINYGNLLTGDHPTIGTHPQVHYSSEDQDRTVENYGDHEKQENLENHGEITEDDSYRFQGYTDHGGHHFLDNFQNHHYHQEPEIHEVTKVVPVHKTINIPEPHKVQKILRIPVPVKVLEPYAIEIPIPFTVEKTVHVPVEKIIKYKVEKPVPVTVEKKVRVPVPKPYPVPFPVYKLKLVLHSGGSSH